MRRTERDRLLVLQVGRGIAAFAVLMFHASAEVSTFDAAVPHWLMLIASRGTLGVDFFFVLSGFIILHAHFSDPQTTVAAGAYGFKRVTRVYLPYLPVALIMIVENLFFGNLSHTERSWGYLSSLLLVPSSRPSILPVAWTLIHEVLFYAIFVLYFFDRRIFACAVGVWGVAMIGGIHGAVPLTAILLDPINLEFCFGLACAVCYRSLNARCAEWLVAAGFSAVIVSLVWLPDVRETAGFGMALLILGLALKEKQWRFLTPAPLVRLGNASYPIYLIHMPLLALVARGAARMPVLDDWIGGMVFSLSCVILVALAYHILYERPVLTAARTVPALCKKRWTNSRLRD